MCGSEPGFVVCAWVAGVVADGGGAGEGLGEGEGVGDEPAVEVCRGLWGEGGGEAVFDVSGCRVFDEEEEAAWRVGGYGVISLVSRLAAKRSMRSWRGAEGVVFWNASRQVRQGQTREAW